MKDSVVSDNVDEFSSVLADLEATAPHSALKQATASSPSGKLITLPSYQPYPWQPLNRILDLVDTTTKGRAGLFQRLVSYLFFGGLAALVNLLVFYIMDSHILATYSVTHRVLGPTLSYCVAAELSILANFIPNDRFTFKHLPGAKRPWIQRCWRFHATTIVGSILTYLIMMALSLFTPIPRIYNEAIATLLVLIYNFSFHHLFTYRHTKHA